MSIESKRSYRYEFLKSEEWASIRAEVMVRERSRCFICESDEVSNDVHHMFYRKQWRDTRATDCHVLCRRCHELVHDQMSKEEIRSMSVPDLKRAFSVLTAVLKARFKQEIWSNRAKRGDPKDTDIPIPTPKKPADFLRAILHRTQAELLALRATEIPGLPKQEVESTPIATPKKSTRSAELRKEIRLLKAELAFAKDEIDRLKSKPTYQFPSFPKPKDDFIGPKQPKRPVEFLREALEKCHWQRDNMASEIASLKSEIRSLKSQYNHNSEWTNWSI